MTAFGLVLLASCLHQRALETTLVMIIPLLAMTLALRWLADGNASNRRARLAFLVSAAGAMTFAELGWSIALFMR